MPARLIAGLMGLLLAALAPAPAAAQEADPQGAEAAPKADATQPEINAAIDKGVQYLLRRQHLDGSWKADEHRYAAGQTGLAVYTLLKGGLKKSHPAVVRGLAFIEAHPPHWTYATACCLMALETADPVRYADLIEELTAVLLESQGTGFSYPGHHEDLSLTQYGCLGLRPPSRRVSRSRVPPGKTPSTTRCNFSSRMARSLTGRARRTPDP